MTYSEVFGGGTINPAQRLYLALTTAVDVTLNWPTNTVATDNVAADIIDVDATAPGVNVSLSDAREVSNGFTSLFVNVGSNSFDVLDSLGGSIVSPAPGTAWFIYLTDNSTEDGTWAIFQLGATTSVADASALAGAGLTAISNSLNQEIAPTTETSSPVTWTAANRALLTIWGGGVGVLDLPTPVSVGSDWFAYVRNEGTGTLTVTPAGAETIDGSATLVMNPGESCAIVTDNTDWYTIGLGSSSTVGFDFVEIDVSGSGDFTLSGVQLDRISYRFIGALTGNRKIIVPNTIQQYWVDNSTTGAFTFEVATAAQVTPISVVQNNRSILYCDGTDVVDAETGTLTPPVTVGQGGTGATNAADARTNLGCAFDGQLIIAGDGMAGGGDLSADRTLDFDLSSITGAAPATGDFLAFEDIDNANVNRKATITDILALGNITDVEPSVAASRLLRGDGSGGWDDAGANIEIDSIGRLVCMQQLRIRAGASIGVDNTNQMLVSATGTIISFAPFGTVTDFVFSTFDSVELNSSLKLFNFGAATDADEAGYGQLYARSGGQPSPELVWVDDGGTEYPIIEQGSFTIDFDVGFSDSNVVTIIYQRIGDVVHITLPSANGGNSNANTLGTGADWPASLRPASTRYGSTICTENSAEQVLGSFTLTSAGVLSFFAPNAGDAGDYGNFWAASGVKFVNGGWSWTYRITDS